jgi:hypothetical protein
MFGRFLERLSRRLVLHRQSYMSVVVGSGRQDFATALNTLLQSNQRLANAGVGGAPYAHKRLAISRRSRASPRRGHLDDSA